MLCYLCYICYVMLLMLHMLCYDVLGVFDFIRRLDYKSGFFLQINILEGRAGHIVLKGHISFIPLTDNRNS